MKPSPWQADCSITPAQLDRLGSPADFALVDVRGYGEFGRLRLAGATCIPLAELRTRAAEIPADRPVVCVCATGRRSHEAVRELRSQGIAARQLEGGIAAWRSEGRPVWVSPGWAIERQVRLGAGSLVVLGFAAAQFWAPARFLALLIGVGLVVAAVSDTCLMGAVLLKMPWNRPRSPHISGGPATVAGHGK